ncbi:hypothetical protein CEE45_13265 [Candidatus Heimdallarchaeota archaeon B3_Heim]|nr:MAG: hypothetical protein CEE45_13265 [Candidatus Heimdallarchaeota archaeon B3_Heim]
MNKIRYFLLKQKNKENAEKAWNLGLLENPAMPIRVTLNTTHKCNLQCIMCQFHRHPSISKRIIKKKDELSQDLFESFANQVFPTLIEAETTTVGEPFLSSYFYTIISKAEEYDVKLYVTTNGLNLTDDKILDLLPVMSTLVISIDAVERNLYESIRRGASFERLKANIDRFLELRKSLEKDSQPQLTLQMTLLRSNIKELPKMVDFASEIGAEHVKAYHAYIYDQEMRRESLFFHQTLSNQCIEETYRIASKKGVKVDLPRKFPLRKEKLFSPKKQDFIKPPCLFLWTESFLEPTGEISACFFPIKYVLGSIATQSFQDIWNCKKMQELREDIQQEPPIGFCKNCELRYTYLPLYSGSGMDPAQFFLIDDPSLSLYRKGS